MTALSPGIVRVDHIAISVVDLAQAKAMFVDGFGLTLVSEFNQNGLRGAFLRCGGIGIELIEASVSGKTTLTSRPPIRAQVAHIALEVTNLDIAIQALAALGVEQDAPVAQEDGRAHIWTVPGTSLDLVFQFTEQLSE
jgi:catechol 2,3-dioxygenase-like lactoylglutathione lyase family enzyme